jgi:hypothetical protein
MVEIRPRVKERGIEKEALALAVVDRPAWPEPAVIDGTVPGEVALVAELEVAVHARFRLIEDEYGARPRLLGGEGRGRERGDQQGAQHAT